MTGSSLIEETYSDQEDQKVSCIEEFNHNIHNSIVPILRADIFLFILLWLLFEDTLEFYMRMPCAMLESSTTGHYACSCISQVHLVQTQ